MRNSMKYIVALIRTWGVSPLLREMDGMNAHVHTISAAPAARNRKAPTGNGRSHPGDGRLPERVFVGIVGSEDSVQSALDSIMRTRGAIHAEVVDLLYGMFGIDQSRTRRPLPHVPVERTSDDGCPQGLDFGDGVPILNHNEEIQDVRQVAIGVA